jgi:hypothetical protein
MKNHFKTQQLSITSSIVYRRGMNGIRANDVSTS